MTMSLTRHPVARALTMGATALLTVGLLGACSSSDSGSAEDTSASASATEDSEVTVLDQTNLLLVTAEETFEAKGLVVEVSDATGQGRSIDDPSAWVVVSQDPIDGTVPAGSTITLTARMTTDPAN